MIIGCAVIIIAYVVKESEKSAFNKLIQSTNHKLIENQKEKSDNFIWSENYYSWSFQKHTWSTIN